jgi:hypothetical protein
MFKHTNFLFEFPKIKVIVSEIKNITFENNNMGHLFVYCLLKIFGVLSSGTKVKSSIEKECTHYCYHQPSFYLNNTLGN